MERVMKQRNPRLLIKAVKPRAALSITHPNAAGIDIGSASHFVAVPPDRDDQTVREFASFTVDLHSLADRLDACAVDTVAMESTGGLIPLLPINSEVTVSLPKISCQEIKHLLLCGGDVLISFYGRLLSTPNGGWSNVKLRGYSPKT
jgi:transposase